MPTTQNNKKKTQMVPKKPRAQKRRRTRKRGSNGNLGRAPPNTKLTRMLPSGVNNKATVPRFQQYERMRGDETIANIVIPRTAIQGDKVYNERISHESVERLAVASRLYQHVKWNTCQFKIVALNGTKVSNGYTAGFIEDPELEMPVSSADTIRFLTTLRGTEINQNWCQSVVGQVAGQCLPKMYTQKGTDLRRFYIGRLVVAANGPPGDDPVTFQLMMKYDVEFKIPCVRPNVVNPGVKIDADIISGAIRMVGTGLKAELPAVAMSYAGKLPPPGIYEVPNATIPLHRLRTNFGWNENDEGSNILFYKSWPADLYQNSSNIDLSYLVIPNGAKSIEDCGFKTSLTADTILFSTLSDVSATVTISNYDEDTEGIDVVIPEGLSWLPQVVSFDDVKFSNSANGKLPINFGSNYLLDTRPLIKRGTTITQVAPAPSLLEIKAEQLSYRYDMLVKKLGELSV